MMPPARITKARTRNRLESSTLKKNANTILAPHGLRQSGLGQSRRTGGAKPGAGWPPLFQCEGTSDMRKRPEGHPTRTSGEGRNPSARSKLILLRFAGRISTATVDAVDFDSQIGCLNPTSQAAPQHDSALPEAHPSLEPHHRSAVLFPRQSAGSECGEVASPRLSIVIPHLRHYVCFPYTDPWLAYVRSIVASYDDFHILKAVVAGAGLGAGISETATGALIGGGIALLLAANAQTRPAGLPMMCPSCRSLYNIHVVVAAMRCPVCNARIRLAPQNPLNGVTVVPNILQARSLR